MSRMNLPCHAQRRRGTAGHEATSLLILCRFVFLCACSLCLLSVLAVLQHPLVPINAAVLYAIHLMRHMSCDTSLLRCISLRYISLAMHLSCDALLLRYMSSDTSRTILFSRGTSFVRKISLRSMSCERSLLRYISFYTCLFCDTCLLRYMSLAIHVSCDTSVLRFISCDTSLTMHFSCDASLLRNISLRYMPCERSLLRYISCYTCLFCDACLLRYISLAIYLV